VKCSQKITKIVVGHAQCLGSTKHGELGESVIEVDAMSLELGLV